MSCRGCARFPIQHPLHSTNSENLSIVLRLWLLCDWRLALFDIEFPILPTNRGVSANMLIVLDSRLSRPHWVHTVQVHTTGSQSVSQTRPRLSFTHSCCEGWKEGGRNKDSSQRMCWHVLFAQELHADTILLAVSQMVWHSNHHRHRLRQ